MYNHLASSEEQLDTNETKTDTTQQTSECPAHLGNGALLGSCVRPFVRFPLPGLLGYEVVQAHGQLLIDLHGVKRALHQASGAV